MEVLFVIRDNSNYQLIFKQNHFQKLINMKLLLRNYSEYRKKLNEGQSYFDSKDYPFFCITLGYLLNKVPDFDILYQTLKGALNLVLTDKLPEAQYFQWLFFLNQNPYRLNDCIAFIENLKNQQSIDVLQEIQILFNSDIYQKKTLKMKNKYNSFDTIVVGSQSPLKEEIFDEKEKESYQNKTYLQMMKQMQEDEQIARKLQQQEESLMRLQNGKIKDEQTLCEICYIDLYEGNPSFLDNCGHGFHKQCLTESFKSQIFDNNFPLKCPNQTCKAECFQGDVKSILQTDLYIKYQDHTLKAYADINGDSVSWCPTADCGYMFFYQKGDPVRFECLQCRKQYCLNCRCQWHHGMSCAQYKVSTTFSEEDNKFLQFVKGKKYKQCPKCKLWVEKTQGCDHMTCKCKFQFCYKCGGVYMKCQCVEKARLENQRRIAIRQQNRRRKLQKAQQKSLKKEALSKQRLLKKQMLQKEKMERQQKGEKPRRGRSKK